MATGGRRAVKAVLIAAAALAAAWQAYDFSIMPLLRASSPDMALARAPDDPIALSKRVHARTVEAGTYAYRAEDVRAAQQSLAHTPLSRSSIRIIGMDAAQNGDRGRARNALELAHRVSRRDPWTEAWLMEDSARNNDFDGIMRHYHAALSVNPELAPALNPMMVKATAFPPVKKLLRGYLRNNALWTPGFLEQAANEGALTDVVDIVQAEAPFLGDDQYAPAMGRIVYRLAADGRWDEAMQLATSAWADFDRAGFEDLNPSESSTDERLGKLAWTLGNQDGIETFLDASGAIEATLEPLARGFIASRDVPVRRGGAYAFIQRIGFADGGASARLMWEAHCIAASNGDERKIWEQSIPVSSSATTYRSTITVPAGCSLLSLRLSGRGSDGEGAVGVRVSDLDLRKTS